MAATTPFGLVLALAGPDVGVSTRALKLWGRVWKFGDHTAHTRVIDVVLPPTLMSTISGGSGRVRKGDAWDEMVVITDVETN